MKAIQFLLAAILMGLGGVKNLRGVDVADYGMVKSIQYQQTNDNAPIVLVSNAYMFTAFVVPTSNHVVTNATVKPGNSTPMRTLTSDTNGSGWIYTELFDSQAAMDSEYPTGSGFSPVNYTMVISSTNDGVHSASLNFFLIIIPVAYPTTPQITNTAAITNIDTTRDFQIGWDSLGGSSLAIVQLSILDAASNVVFASPAPFQPGGLNGSSGGSSIPAYALPPGTNLIGHLTIANPGAPNTNAYPGGVGVTALARDTRFPVVTRIAPQPPILSLLPPNSGRFQLRCNGESNRIYNIQGADDLRTWTNLFTTNSTSGVFDFTDVQSTNRPIRYYRARIGQ